MTIPLVFLRHGQSVWNQQRRFTGWADVGLSPTGRTEAETAGRLLKRANYRFDVCFTSVLQRARQTLDIVLDSLGQSGLPVHTSWRLNERHYGALEGLSRGDAAERYSPRQVTLWQQHFDICPPPLEPGDRRFPGHDPRYRGLAAADLPRTESLKDVRARVLPYWQHTILPCLPGRPARPGRGPRQQPAGAHDLSRRRPGGDDSKNQKTPDRRAIGVRV